MTTKPHMPSTFLLMEEFYSSNDSAKNISLLELLEIEKKLRTRIDYQPNSLIIKSQYGCSNKQIFYSRQVPNPNYERELQQYHFNLKTYFETEKSNISKLKEELNQKIITFNQDLNTSKEKNLEITEINSLPLLKDDCLNCKKLEG